MRTCRRRAHLAGTPRRATLQRRVALGHRPTEQAETNMRLLLASVILLAPRCQTYTLCTSSSLPRRIAATTAVSTSDLLPRMSEAWFVATADLSADPYAIVGVERGADIAEIKRAYRARARELHPDTRAGVGSAANGTEDGTEGNADRFSALVGAYQHLAQLDSKGHGLVPGSAETHPLWDRLPDFYHHW